MSDGVDYRLGILSGRLKGYENEEDILKLMKQIVVKSRQEKTGLDNTSGKSKIK